MDCMYQLAAYFCTTNALKVQADILSPCLYSLLPHCCQDPAPSDLLVDPVVAVESPSVSSGNMHHLDRPQVPGCKHALAGCAHAYLKGGTREVKGRYKGGARKYSSF